jgi:hypothetical protein
MTEEPCLPRAFARALAHHALADAWLFLAPGRRRARAAAFDCAAALLGLRGDPRGHPDCALFDPQELEVDGLRVEHIAQRKEGVASVESALRYKPLAGTWRAVLLPDADLMNFDAQGALLKTAEEPPAGTVLLLSGTDLGAFLPAIRSRCRVVRLGPESRELLDRRAAAAGLSAAEAALLVGAIGAEASMDLAPEQRVFLLERLLQITRWQRGEDPDAAWLAALEDGGTVAEARARAHLLLQAALGHLLTSDPTWPPAESWVERLDRALGDLDVNLTPAWVLADLRKQARTGSATLA